jgi:hypothetical protein
VVDMTRPKKSFISLPAVPSLILAVPADPVRADLIVCTCSDKRGHSDVCVVVLQQEATRTFLPLSQT